ncbi:MAG: tRNA pseudouridine(38-40) synthase TruA [Oligoflexales bacterium]
MGSQDRIKIQEDLVKTEGQAYRIDLSYIGTPFNGFQSQVSKNGIQDHLEKALRTFLNHDLRVRGASRTDSGVHAHHQVALFRTKVPYSPRWLLSLNALTPIEIGIQKLCPVDHFFDPIFDSKGKAYRYRLWQGRCFNPFTQSFVWPVHQSIDLKLLAKEAADFIGTHDFNAFCNKDSDAKTTIRKIFDVKCDERGPMIDIWITGEGFLKQMVRIMVGTLVAVMQGHLPPGSIRNLLAGGLERKLAGMTAPAKGLALVEVFYNEVGQLDKIISKCGTHFCFPYYDDHLGILAAGQK